MKQINFLWKGPTGLNPDLGYVVNNEPVTIRSDDMKEKFLKLNLIGYLNKKLKNEVIVNAERKEKTGKTIDED